jgi:hypothetical protein
MSDRGKETTVFLIMLQEQKKAASMEWACRILITFLFFRVLTGYITNWQTE